MNMEGPRFAALTERIDWALFAKWLRKRPARVEPGLGWSTLKTYF
jgi:hypothetical protein